MRCATIVLIPLLFWACGGEDASGPSPDFPRTFTARSTNCSSDTSVSIADPGRIIEDRWMTTVEVSSDRYFAGEAVIVHSLLIGPDGGIVDEARSGVHSPTAFEGTWSVDISAPTNGHLQAAGTGTGDLAERVIEFIMQPLPGGCGYTSTGTIR